MTPLKDINFRVYFAPFRPRSSNPAGFDSKMKHWINAIEDWSLTQKRLLFSLRDIQNEFMKDDIKPDKECIRLVLSEMKRKSVIILHNNSNPSSFVLENYNDSNSWLVWGVKKLVLTPASMIFSTLVSPHDTIYSDLTDMSITDDMIFMSTKTLEKIASDVKNELIRISKAEHRQCFEWPQLLELLSPILQNIVNCSDMKQAVRRLEMIMVYLAQTRNISISQESDVKVVKIATNIDNLGDDLTITKKDIANARLLRARDLLTNDADRLHARAMVAKKQAVESYKNQNIVKAKALLRNYKRLSASAEQREAQLANVEHLLDQLESTSSNIMIMQAYKDGADALKVANTKFEDMSYIMDDAYETTAEANHLQQTFNEMVNDLSHLSEPSDLSMANLEEELKEYAKDCDNMPQQYKLPIKKEVEDIIAQLDNIIIDREIPNVDVLEEKKEEKPVSHAST